MSHAYAPFGGAPPHLIHPGLSYAVWFTEPLGVVTRMLKPAVIDQGVANFITGPLHLAVRALAPAGARTVAVHDWSIATRYDTVVRLRLTEWTLAHRHELARVVVTGPKENAVLRMGAQVAQAILAVAGCALEVSQSLSEALERHPLSLYTGKVPSVPGTEPAGSRVGGDRQSSV